MTFKKRLLAALSMASAALFSISVMAQQSLEGPEFLPPSSKNNAVFPKVKQPAAGWEDILDPGAKPIDGCSEEEQFAVFRVSRLIGSREIFEDAVAEHNAYFRSVGINDNKQIIINSIAPDGRGGYGPNLKIVSTLHVNPPSRERQRRERETFKAKKAYEEFAEKYRESSEILEEAWLCIPRDSGLE